MSFVAIALEFVIVSSFIFSSLGSLITDACALLLTDRSCFQMNLDLSSFQQNQKNVCVLLYKLNILSYFDTACSQTTFYVALRPFPIRLAAGKRISSFPIEQKLSYNLVMVGSSGLGRPCPIRLAVGKRISSFPVEQKLAECMVQDYYF